MLAAKYHNYIYDYRFLFLLVTAESKVFRIVLIRYIYWADLLDVAQRIGAFMMAAKIILSFLLVFVVWASLMYVKAEKEATFLASARRPNGSSWNQTRPSRPKPPHKKCRQYEEYKKCVSGSCSEWKCKYLYKGWPDACTYDCASGCFCRKGYFRNYAKRCVLGYHCFKEIMPFVSTLPE
uniref:TIL domain containing protein n=1 Tax=Rhipicephalus zambeziensis TaxID=60191 RepID=A0A224YRJ8_9ACAR